MALAGDFLEGQISTEHDSPETQDDRDLRERYLEVLAVKTANPIHCGRGCLVDGKAVFIPQEDIREEQDLAICRICKGGTCTLCKKPAPHGDLNKCEIEEDEARQDIRYQRLSGRSGWKRCEGCEMMVSRDIGCSHVVCRFVSVRSIALI
jgi:hypothetical protein